MNELERLEAQRVMAANRIKELEESILSYQRKLRELPQQVIKTAETMLGSDGCIASMDLRHALRRVFAEVDLSN